MNLFHLGKKEKYSIEHFMGKQRNNFLILKNKNKIFESKINRNKTRNFKKKNFNNTKNLNYHKYFFNSSKTVSEMNKSKAKKKIKMMDIKNKQNIENSLYRKKFDDSKLSAKKNNKSKKYKKIDKSDDYFSYETNSDSSDTYNKNEDIDNKNYELKFKKPFEKNKLNNECTKNNTLSSKLNCNNIELKYESAENDKLYNNSYYEDVELKNNNIQNDNVSNHLNGDNIRLKNHNDQNDDLSDSIDNNIELKVENTRNIDLYNNLNKNSIELKFENIENTDSSNHMDYKNVELKFGSTENINMSNNLSDILEKKNYEFSRYTYDKYINEKDLKKNDICNNGVIERQMIKNKLNENEYIIRNEINKCENLSFYNMPNTSDNNSSNYLLQHEEIYDFKNNLNHSSNRYDVSVNISDAGYKINTINEENHLNTINQTNNIKKINISNEMNNSNELKNINEINAYSNINLMKNIKNDRVINDLINNNKTDYINYIEKHINNENLNNNYMNNDFFNHNINFMDIEASTDTKNIDYNKYIDYSNDNTYFNLLENKIIKDNLEYTRDDEMKNDSTIMKEGNGNNIYKDKYIQENIKEESYTKDMKNINMNLKKYKLNDNNIPILEKSLNVNEQNKNMFFYPSYNTINAIKNEIEENIYCNIYDEKILGNLKNEMKGNYSTYPINTSSNDKNCEINNFSKKNYMSIDLNNLNYMKNNYMENTCDDRIYELTDYYNQNFVNNRKDNKLNNYHATSNLYSKNINVSDSFKIEMDYNKNIDTYSSNNKNEKCIETCKNLHNNYNDDYNNNLNYINENGNVNGNENENGNENGNEKNNFNTDEYDTEIEEMKLKKKEFKKMILNNKSEFTTINENDELYKTVLYFEKKNKKILKMRRSLRRKRKLKRMVTVEKDQESQCKDNNDETYEKSRITKNEEYIENLDDKNESIESKNYLEDNLLKQENVINESLNRNNNNNINNNNSFKNIMEIEKGSAIFTNQDNNTPMNKIKMNEENINEKGVNNNEDYENSNLIKSSSENAIDKNNVKYRMEDNHKKKYNYEPKKNVERKYKKLKSNENFNKPNNKYRIVEYENKLNNSIDVAEKYYTNENHSSISVVKKYEQSDSEEAKTSSSSSSKKKKKNKNKNKNNNDDDDGDNNNNNDIEKFTCYKEKSELSSVQLNDQKMSNYDIKEEKKNASITYCDSNEISESLKLYEENLRYELNDNFEENNGMSENNNTRKKTSRRTLRDLKEKSKKDDDYIYDDDIFNEKIKKRRNKFKSKNTLKKNRKFCENKKFDMDISNSENILDNNEASNNDKEKINEQKQFLTYNIELINEYLKQNKSDVQISKEKDEEKGKNNITNERTNMLSNNDIKNILSGNLLDSGNNTDVYNETNNNLINIKKGNIIQIINSNLLGVKSIDSPNKKNDVDFKSKRKQKRSVKIYRVHKNRTETPLEKKLRIKICLEDYYKRNKEIYNNIDILSSINDINLPSIEDENFNDNLTILLKKKKKNLICSNCLYSYKVQISKRNEYMKKIEAEDHVKCNEIKEKKGEKIKGIKKRCSKKNKNKGEDTKDINDTNNEAEEETNLHEQIINEKYMDINSYKELIEKNVLAENYCKITFYCLCGYFKYIKEDDEWKQIINCYYDEKEELKPKAPYIFCIKCKELLITNRFLDKDKTKIIMICECGSRNYDRVNFFWVRRGNIKQRKAPQILCEECQSKMWVHTWLDDIGSKVKLLCKCGFKNFLKKNNNWVRSPRWKKPVPLIICNSCQQKMYMSQWLNNDGTKVKMKCECGWKTLIKEGNTWVRSEWSKKLLCLRLVKNPHLLQKKYNIHSRRKNKSIKNDLSDENKQFVVLKNEEFASLNDVNNNEINDDELNNTSINGIKKDKNINNKIKKNKTLKNTSLNEKELRKDELCINNGNSTTDLGNISNVDIKENNEMNPENANEEIILNQKKKTYNTNNANINNMENYINFKQNKYNNLSKNSDYNSNSEKNETTVNVYNIMNSQEKSMITNHNYDSTKYNQQNNKTDIENSTSIEEGNFEIITNDANKRQNQSIYIENKQKEHNSVYSDKLKNVENYTCSLMCDRSASTNRRYKLHHEQDGLNNINENVVIENLNNNENLHQNNQEMEKNSLNGNTSYDFYDMKNMSSEDKANNDFNKMYFENSYYYANNYYDRYDKNYCNQTIPFNENNYNENNSANINFYETFIPANSFPINNDYALNYNMNVSLDSFHDKKYIKNEVLLPQSYDKKKIILGNIKKFDNNMNEIDVNSILENLDEKTLIETFIENLIDKNEIEKNKIDDNEMSINEMYQNKMCQNKLHQDSMCQYEMYQNGMYQNGLYQNEIYQNEFYQNIIENTFDKNEMDKNEINKNEMNQNLIENMIDKNEVNKNIVSKIENSENFNSDIMNKNVVDKNSSEKNSIDKNSVDENILKENLMNNITNNDEYSNNYNLLNDPKEKEKYNNEMKRSIEENISLKNINNTHEINSNNMCSNNDVENTDFKNFNNSYYKNVDSEKDKKNENILNDCNFHEESQYFNNEFKNIIDHIFSDKSIANETFNDYVKNVAYNFCKSLNKSDNMQNNKQECATDTCEENKNYLKENKDEEMKNYKELSFSINDHENSSMANNFCNEFNFYENIINLQKINGEMKNDLSSYKSQINDITPEKNDANEMFGDYSFNSDGEEKVCSHERKYKINDFITICKNCHEYINHIDYKMLSSNNMEETDTINELNIEEKNMIQNNDLKNYDETISEKKDMKNYNENIYNSVKIENNIALNYLENQNECNNNYSGNNSNQCFNNNFPSIENMEKINQMYNQYCDFYMNNSVIDDIQIKNNYLSNFFFQEQNNYSSTSEHFTNNQTPIKNENFYFSEDNNYLSDSTNYINTNNFSNKEVSSKEESYKENSNDNNNCDDNYQENYSNYINSECNNNSCYNIIHI